MAKYFALLPLLAAASLTPAAAQTVRSASPHKHASGYVYYAPRANTDSFLIDNQANIVHQWPGSTNAALGAHLLPDGSILRTGVQFNPVFNSGAGGGGLIEHYSWSGDLLFRYVLSSDKLHQHHDAIQLPNGNFLILAWELHTPEQALAAGRKPEILPASGLWSEAIFEIHPTGPESADTVWEWHAFDHLVQDFDPAKPHFANPRSAPHRMDLNFTGSNANPANNPDWLHANSLDYNPHLDQIIINFRSSSEFFILDHSTTTAEAATSSGGRYKKGGDILYRWGNPQSWRAGTAADQKLFNQHDAQWIPQGHPGEGNILILNNGIGRGYASADEIVPPLNPDGSYALPTNAPYGPERILWSFGETAGVNFTTQTGGGAERLPNGNTLIALSNANRLVEVTPEKEIVWDLNLASGDAGGYTFRAQRLPASHSAFRKTSLYVPAPQVEHAALARSAPLAPDAIAEAFMDLDAGPMDPAATIQVTDSSGVSRPARILSANPAALQFQIPENSQPGPAALVFHNSTGPEQVVDIRINPAAPGLYSANRDGQGPGAILAIWQSANGQQTTNLAYQLDEKTARYVAVPLTLSTPGRELYLTLYGTGFGSDIAKTGPLTATIAGRPVPILSAASLPTFPGLDQINLGPIPPSLAGNPAAPIVLTLSAIPSNPVTVNLQ